MAPLGGLPQAEIWNHLHCTPLSRNPQSAKSGSTLPSIWSDNRFSAFILVLRAREKPYLEVCLVEWRWIILPDRCSRRAPGYRSTP